MTFSITHATRYVLLAAALATLGGCATPQQQAQMQAEQQLQAQQQLHTKGEQKAIAKADFLERSIFKVLIIATAG